VFVASRGGRKLEDVSSEREDWTGSQAQLPCVRWERTAVVDGGWCLLRRVEDENWKT
jgi:hypothetical protein